MRRKALSVRRHRKKFLFATPLRGVNPNHAKLSSGQRTGLIKDQRL